MIILGVQLDFPHLRTCLLRKNRQGVQIASLQMIPIATDPNVPDGHPQPNPESLFGSANRDVKRVYTERLKKRIVSGLSAHQFLMRSTETKLAGRRHFEEAAVFQSQALSHFKSEEILTVPFTEKHHTDKTEVVLFTVPKASLEEHLAALARFQIDPDAVTTVPSALCRFMRWKFPNLQDVLIIDLGSSEITCVLMEKGELKKSHGIARGIEKLLEALHEDRKKILLKKEIESAAKQIDLLLLKQGLNPRLSKELVQLRQELAQIHYSFTRNAPKPVLFTGRTDAFIHLKEFLIHSAEGEHSLSGEHQKFAVSIGLALDQASKQPLQLRQGEFFPTKNWARMGFYAVLLLSASMLLGASLFSAGLSSVASRREKMLHFLETSSKKHLLSRGTPEERIDQWICAIEANKAEYPYILQAPKVADVLCWLSSNPVLEQLKNEGDPIDLKEIKYELASLPTPHSRSDPFLVKIEIEFNFKNMINAKRFHEALRTGDDWVDPDSEITWDTLTNGCRASFYMKNKGPYVP